MQVTSNGIESGFSHLQDNVAGTEQPIGQMQNMKYNQSAVGSSLSKVD